MRRVVGGLIVPIGGTVSELVSMFVVDNEFEKRLREFHARRRNTNALNREVV